MSTDRIERTSIWANSLGQEDRKSNAELERLRSSFRDVRNKAAVLTNQISSDFRNLTQHDISHLDALWETASLLIGEEYKINPVEAYVLGCAILLHDSGLSFAAFEGGTSEIRESTFWLDLNKELLSKNPDRDKEELMQICDFISVRYLHAEQAQVLMTRRWKNPRDGSPIFLIEDSELRNSYGSIIGEIAASHHWEIEKLDSLPSQINAIPGFPRDWRINPRKLACILRCADAMHIDSERAPTFLFALYEKAGVSFDHWNGQNKMAQVDLYAHDENSETLIFTSTSNFEEGESDSWWVIYDALTLVSKEISNSNNYLEKRFSKDTMFKVRKVYGLESLDKITEVIKVQNWTPNLTQLHVGNIESLITNLGGEKLYTQKDKFMVVARELLQNSTDAIRARRKLESGFRGRIKIFLKKIDLGIVFEILDDGVGMSQGILTGSLLDFGTSFWTSSLIKQEFPGLLSSNYKSIGQFGIGFYSSFMVSKSVLVSSIRYDASRDSANTLLFKNGITLRPLLKKTNEVLDGFQTRVSLLLKDETLNSLEEIEILSNPPLNPNFKVPLSDYFCSLCPALDIDLYLNINDNEELIHPEIKEDGFDSLEFLKKLAFNDYFLNEGISKYIEANHHRLDFIYDKDTIVGIAALSTQIKNDCTYLNNRTIGGFSVNVHERRSLQFIGCADHVPISANRTTNRIDIPKPQLDQWIEKQKEKLPFDKLNPIERIGTMMNLCSLEYDPIEYFTILARQGENHYFVDESNLFEFISKKGLTIMLTSGHSYLSNRFKMNQVAGRLVYWPVSSGGLFNTAKLSESNVPTEDYSILGCIHRLAKKHSVDLEWDFEDHVINGEFDQFKILNYSIKSS